MTKALQSQAFPGAYLRIDGTGVNAPTTTGGGTVNCQSGVADFETYTEKPQLDGAVALESAAFPGVYLRMDGSGLSAPNSAGAGTVNCAFGVGAWERFHKRPQPDGSIALESAAFPGVYLRMDAQDVGTVGLPAGVGTVNCQVGVGPWEKFFLLDPPFPSIRWPSADGAQTGIPKSASVQSATFRTSDYDSDYSAATDGNYIYEPSYGVVDSGNTYDFVATGSATSQGSLGVADPIVPADYSRLSTGPEVTIENSDTN